MIEDRRESRRQNIPEVVRKERQFGETDKGQKEKGMVTDERSHKEGEGQRGQKSR